MFWTKQPGLFPFAGMLLAVFIATLVDGVRELARSKRDRAQGD
jgi:hypothetical protein